MKTKGVVFGYGRVSTAEQDAGLTAQERDLKAAGCETIVLEKVSAVSSRPRMEDLITFARRGDTIVVTKIDRLARSVRNLLDIKDRLAAKGVELKILSMPELNGASGQLILSVLGAIAEFERQLMLERQAEGIAVAKAEGKYKGRAPTARRKLAEVVRLAGEGKSKAQIGRAVGLPERTVFRLLAEARGAA